MAAAGGALRWYAAEPRAVRARVSARWRTAPIEAIADLLPSAGRVLDWGCGHGLVALVLASRAAEVEVQGVDIDGAKVAVASRAAAEAGFADRVSFEVVRPGDRPDGSWDGIVLCDVLYLQDPHDRAGLVAAAAGALATGGVLICKEVGRSPRWKWLLCSLQEQVSVRLLRITQAGTGLGGLPDPVEVAGWMAAAGLDVEQVPLGRGSHVPHVAVIGRRREPAPER